MVRKIIVVLRKAIDIFYLFLAGMYEGTKIFVSGLTQAMTQRFFNLVLLPRIRDDLAEFKVNFQLKADSN